MIRLWVAATDYRDDVRVSEEILKSLADGYRKIRNTVRYALSNLYDFDPARDSVPEAELLPLDRWALGQLHELTGRILAAYEAYEFHVVFHAVLEFCSNTLSAQYFDINKDRLYTFKTNGRPRRSAQTVIFAITRDLLRLVAPILAFTADEAFAFLPGEKPASVLLAGMPERRPAAADATADAELAQLFALRTEVNGALEVMRPPYLRYGSSSYSYIVGAEP